MCFIHNDNVVFRGINHSWIYLIIHSQTQTIIVFSEINYQQKLSLTPKIFFIENPCSANQIVGISFHYFFKLLEDCDVWTRRACWGLWSCWDMALADCKYYRLKVCIACIPNLVPSGVQSRHANFPQNADFVRYPWKCDFAISKSFWYELVVLQSILCQKRNQVLDSFFWTCPFLSFK